MKTKFKKKETKLVVWIGFIIDFQGTPHIDKFWWNNTGSIVQICLGATAWDQLMNKWAPLPITIQAPTCLFYVLWNKHACPCFKTRLSHFLMTVRWTILICTNKNITPIPLLILERGSICGKNNTSAMLKIQTSLKSSLETSFAGKWIVFMFHTSFFFLPTETWRISPNNLIYLSLASMVIDHSFGSWPQKNIFHGVF